jgi:hypothetical protein
MKVTAIILGILILTLLSSCGFYQPALVDMPLIKGKKDLRVDVGGAINPSVYTTVSYGLTNKIAVQTFAKIAGQGIFYVQGALGLYKPLSDNRVLEWYNGVGYGYGYAYNDANPGNLTGNYHQIFTQLNYGKTGCRFANMDFGVGLKAAYIGADRLNNHYYYWEDIPLQISTVENHSLLIEPQAFVRLGGKRLKFSTKVGYGMLFKLFNTDRRLPYYPLNLGIGLNYSF